MDQFSQNTKKHLSLKTLVIILVIISAVGFSLGKTSLFKGNINYIFDQQTYVQDASTVDSTETATESFVLPPGENIGPPITIAPPGPALTAGGAHACFLRSAGEIWCWGGAKTIYKEVEVIDGTTSMITKMKVPETITFSTPSPVLQKNGQPFGGAIAISAGYNHTCALKNDGTVWCWAAPYNFENNNHFGELGDGTNIASVFPVQVLIKSNPKTPLAGIIAIAAGGSSHTCALKNDANLWCWGNNSTGALGNNSRDNSNVAVAVAGNHKFTAVNAHIGATCAIADQEANLFCWGEATVWGGLGGNGMLLVPKIMTDRLGNPIKEVRMLAHMPTADRFVAFQKNNLGVRDDSLWGMGTIPPGRYVGGPNITNVFEGLGQFVDSNNKPILVKQASTGSGVGGHACVLNKGDSTASCWGVNSYGQLGDGTQVDRQFPTLVQDSQGGSLNKLYQIEVGASEFTCAIKLTDAEEVWCWGWNYYGQLGDGSTNKSTLPVRVKLP